MAYGLRKRTLRCPMHSSASRAWRELLPTFQLLQCKQLRQTWTHLVGLPLAEPDYGIPKAVDLLLGADVFSREVLHGRRFGPPGSPSAFKTHFGWVLTGTTGYTPRGRKSAGRCYLATTVEDELGSDELSRRFWEIENPFFQEPMLSIDEKMVVEHFKATHYRDEKGRFVVPLPMKSDAVPLGESRTISVQRFKSLERSLHAKLSWENSLHISRSTSRWTRRTSSRKGSQ